MYGRVIRFVSLFALFCSFAFVGVNSPPVRLVLGNEMFWVIVLAKGFKKEFVFGYAMCFDPVAAYFVLAWVVAVIVRNMLCVGFLPVYYSFYCAVLCPC